MEKLAWQFDEPFADSSLLPTYLISQAIRQHVKVALSGDGGDELFAGYNSYGFIQQQVKLEVIPRYLRYILSHFHHLLPVGTRGKNFLRRLPLNNIEQFLNLSCQPETIMLSPLNNRIEKEQNNLPEDYYRHTILDELRKVQSNSSMTLLQEMTRLDFLSYLPDDILVKVDRASMLTALEVRSPLLDYRIVEFAYALPDTLRIKGITRKYLLKKLARKYLPPDFPYERKQGFSIPEGDWFKGEWKSFFNNSLKGHSQLLNSSNVAEIQRIHDKSGRYGRYLFNILMLKLFERNYGVLIDET